MLEGRQSVLSLVLLGIVICLASALVSGLLSLLDALSDAARSVLVRLFPLLVSLAVAFGISALVLALPVDLDKDVVTLGVLAIGILSFALSYKLLRSIGRSQVENLTLPIDSILQVRPVQSEQFIPASDTGWLFFRKTPTLVDRHRLVADYMSSIIPEGERIALASKITILFLVSDKPLGDLEAIKLKSKIDTWVREAESILEKAPHSNFGSSVLAEKLTISLEKIASACRLHRIGRTSYDDEFHELRLKHIGDSL